MRTDVGAKAGDVAAAVVDAEPEPAGQRCQRGLGLIAASSRRTQSRTSGCPPTRPDSGEATMLRTRSWVGDGSRPAAATASATASSVGDAADLDVAPRGQFHRRRAEPGRRVGQRLELGRVDHPARQPDPRQRAVGGLMHLQRARTCVLAAGAGHQLTVRVAGVAKWGSALLVCQ